MDSNATPGGPEVDTPARVRSLSAIGRVLGLSRSRMSTIGREPWFPARGEDGLFDVAEAVAAIRANVKLRARNVKPAAPAAAVPEDDPRIQVLRDPSSGPVAIARASMQVAAQGLADGLVAGRSGARAFDDMKHALEELRRCEDSYLSLAQKRGELIERDVAKEVIGSAVVRLVNILAKLETEAALQVEAWVQDEGFRERGTEDRAREVQQWVAARARALRELDVAEIEAAIREAAGEDG